MGAELFSIHPNQVRQLRVDFDRGYRRVINFGGTLYYGTTPNLTVANAAGSIASGSSHLFTDGTWLLAQEYCRVVVDAVPDNPLGEIDPMVKGPPLVVRRKTSSGSDDTFRFEDYDGTVLAFMDRYGTLGMGQQPAYRRNPNLGSLGVIDGLLVAQLDRLDGGPGRLFCRSVTAKMLGDPADINFHRAQGTSTGGYVSIYSTGTVDVVSGSAILTGHGTSWAQFIGVWEGVMSFRFPTSDNPTRDYFVLSVDNDTQITLEDTYKSETESDITYTVGNNGRPYGQNGDGTGLYEVTAGARLGSSAAVGYTPEGSWPGPSFRTGWHCVEDPVQRNLDTTLAAPWTSADTSITLTHDPAAVPIQQLNTRGESQGTQSLRDHGDVVILLDSGKSATVSYSGFDSSSKKLLGCVTRGTPASGAAAGKRVRQNRTQHGGYMTLNPTPRGGHDGTQSVTVRHHGGVVFGEQAAGTSDTSHFRFRAGKLQIEKLNDPSVISATVFGGVGSTRRNYYVILKNADPSVDGHGEVSVPLKKHVATGPVTLSATQYVSFDVTLPTSWFCFDLVRVAADADESDTALAPYELVASNVPVRHTNTIAKCLAVDRGQTVSSGYVLPTFNNTGDLDVGGATRLRGALATGVVNIGTAGDLLVKGQDITVNGRGQTYVINTSAASRDVYLPASNSFPGLMVEIVDGTGNANTNPITIHPATGNNINGGSTYTITQARGIARLGDVNTGAWRATSQLTNPAAATAIDQGIVDAKGDLIVATANDTVARQAVGANNTLVVADSAQGTGVKWANVTNSMIDAAAAIAYSKLALTGSIVNADVNASAAIAYSKLNLATSIVNADVSTSAAIAYSKLNLTTSITSGDLAGALSALIPSSGQKDALAGTSGTPSSTNAYVTSDDLNGRWRPVIRTTGRAPANILTASGVYVAVEGGVFSVQTGVAIPFLINLYAADWAVTGKTTKLRITASAAVNDTAPGQTLTLGLYPVGTPSGATAAILNPNLGTVVSGSTVALSGLTANSKSSPSSSTEFTFPSDGMYATAVEVPAALSANSNVAVIYRLEVRNV